MEIKSVNVKPTNITTIKNQLVDNTVSSGSREFTREFSGYIEDLRRHYACPTKYKLLFENNNMKIFYEFTFGHTVCYGYDFSHNDWYEWAECSYMVHHVDF